MDMQSCVEGRPGRYHIYRQGPLRPVGRRRTGKPRIDILKISYRILIFNVTGIGVAGGGGGPQGLQFHLVPGNQIHGNLGTTPGGRGGLDAIITQLLNQVEDTGPPPPMAEESIKELPNVEVDSVILEKNPNCHSLLGRLN